MRSILDKLRDKNKLNNLQLKLTSITSNHKLYSNDNNMFDWKEGIKRYKLPLKITYPQRDLTFKYIYKFSN